MRLIIAPLILLKLKSKYVKDLTSTIKEGWVDDRDLEAIEYLKSHAWKGLSSPFVISYNFSFLQTQIKTLFVDLTQIYNEDSTSEINLNFSIQKILEALYLIFEDVHSDLKMMKIYKLLEKLPINLFLRITKLNKSIRLITQNKIIRILQKYRVTTKIFRLILIPVLGLPIIMSQLIFSLLYTTLFEGYLRFIYGMILIKVGYYTIYLYSNRNSSLHNRLQFCHKDIVNKGGIIEEKHTQFKDRFIYSTNLDNALQKLSEELTKENIIPSKETVKEGRKFDRILKRVSNTIKNTIESELSSDTAKSFNFKPLIHIAESIGRVYYPNAKQPIYNMRFKEFLEFGFFVTTVSLKNIYAIPASRKLLDKIPVKLVFDINDFIEDKHLKDYIPKIKKGGKIIKNIQSYYWASRMIIKRSHPIVFAASMVTPIILQQVQDSFREYIYNMSGLLLIDAYESSLLRNKVNRINNISE